MVGVAMLQNGQMPAFIDDSILSGGPVVHRFSNQIN